MLDCHNINNEYQPLTDRLIFKFMDIQPTTAKFAVICMMFLNEYPFNKVILMVNKGSIADRDNSLTIWWLVVALSDPIMTQK